MNDESENDLHFPYAICTAGEPEPQSDTLNRVDYLSRQNHDLRGMLAIEYARQNKTSEIYEEWQLANANLVTSLLDDKRTRFVNVTPNKNGS